MNRTAKIIAAIAGLAMAAGCDQGKFPTPDYPDDTIPTEQTWSKDTVECTTDDDCAALEACVSGTCRLKGCEAGIAAAPSPFGQQRYLAIKREPVVASGSSLKQLNPAGGSFTSGATMSPGASVVDIAGGNLFGNSEATAVALSGRKEIAIVVPNQPGSKIPLTFEPIALAAGDVDGDSIEEVVALGASGQIALCKATDLTCTAPTFDHNWTGKDVAVGDIDGDALAEVLFLIASDTSKVVVWNVRAENEVVNYTVVPGRTSSSTTAVEVERIAAGDLNGDTFAEVLGIDDKSILQNDRLYVFSVKQGEMPVKKELVNWNGNADQANDVAVADMSADGRDDVIVLNEGNTAKVFKIATVGAALDTLAFAYSASLPGVSNATRISLVDVNGDSPIGRLIEGPKLVNGQVTPIAVLTFPPFSRTYSDGIASVGVGAGTSYNYSSRESLSIDHGPSLGINASVGVGFKPKILGTEIGVNAETSGSLKWSWGTATSVSKSKSVSVGDTSFSFGARVKNYGTEYAGVLVECGCYTAYTYEIQSDLTTADALVKKEMTGQKLTFLAPVGGQMTLWSSGRYNAMARVLGYLPEINVPFQIGNPASYPETMVTLEGQTVPQEQLLFPMPQTYRTSELGQVGWSISANESQSNESAKSYSFSASGGVSISASGGFLFMSASASASADYSYSRSESTSESMTIGKGVSFGGNIPAVPDNNRTPEDEHSLYGYATTPYVYLQSYTDGGGKNGAYYVLMYMVRK